MNQRMGEANDGARVPGPMDGVGPDTAGGASGTSVGDAAVQVRVETPTRRQLRLQQPPGRAGVPGAGVSREPLPGGRRDRRRQETTQVQVVGDAPMPPVGASGASVPARPAGGMDIEEALAAREAMAQAVGEHATGTPAAGSDPLPVDPDVLAQQKVLAERAALLGSRARGIREVSEQNRRRSPVPNDPAAPDNLSIVAPPDFVQVPGGAQSVLRPPSTSHVPIVLQRPQQPLAPETTHGGGGAETDAASAPGGAGTRPLGACDAFGLDPLDAMTAGLGRLRRLRTIQYSILGVGATALVTGIMMTVSSLNG